MPKVGEVKACSRLVAPSTAPPGTTESTVLQGNTTDTLTPFWQTKDNETVRLYLGDVLEVLRKMPAKSVHCVVTSPPYWGLRDYGTAQWEGGDSSCNHLSSGTNRGPREELPNPPAGWAERAQEHRHLTHCLKCGAKRIDQQIGSERSPEEFVAKMVEVFGEVRRVLRDDGVMWINLGDTYGGVSHGAKDSWDGTDGLFSRKIAQMTSKGNHGIKMPKSTLPSGNLVGIPWRVALALQADGGWILRSDIPFVKRSPMPESVKNRPAKALEYVFMFVKKMGYYFDMEAVRRVHKDPDRGASNKHESDNPHSGRLDDQNGQQAAFTVATSSYNPAGRNFWQADLWFESVDTPHGLTGVGDEIVGIDMTSQSYDGAHFAVYPMKLIRPFILAGTSEKGCCADCGTPWRRAVEEKKLTRERPNDYVKRTGEEGTGNSCSNSVAGVEVKTVGWEPSCTCHGRFEKRKGTRLGYGSYHDHKGDGVEYGLRQKGKGPAAIVGEPTKEFETTIVEYISDLPLDEHPVVPCTVLDPFIGSGTSCVVSLEHGRNSIGIDLSVVYLRNNAIPRIEGALMARPALAHLVGREVKVLSLGRPQEYLGMKRESKVGGDRG